MGKRWHILALLGVSALLLLPGLGRIPVRRQQELRVLLVARDMARGGDWILPHFRGRLRLNKPPLAYWITALAFRLAGNARSAAVGRLPAVGASLALIAVVYAMGAGVYGRKAGGLGALVAATSYLLMRYGRLAETDIYLCLLTAAAAGCFMRAVLKPPARAWWLTGGMAAGLAFLSKGPAALLPLVAATAASFDDRRRGCRGLWFSMGVAWVVALLLPGLWYAAVFQSAALIKDVSAEAEALLGGTGHPGPWFYYFGHFSLGMLPWSLLIPAGLWQAWRRARIHRADRYLLLWGGVSLVALTLIKNKQQHYALLLLPSTAILCGPVLLRGLNRRRSGGSSATRWYLATMAAALAAGVAVAALLPWLKEAVPVLRVIVSLGVVLVFIALGIALSRRPVAGLVTVVLSLAIGSELYALVYVKHQIPESLLPELAKRARPLLTDCQRIYATGHRLAAVEFYLDRTLTDIPPSAIKELHLGPTEAVVAYDRCDRIPRPSGAEEVVRLRNGEYCGVVFLPKDVPSKGWLWEDGAGSKGRGS